MEKTEQFEIIIPTLFGLEAFVGRELKALGYTPSKVEDGRVTFWGDIRAVVLANLWIRCGERVLIKIAEFEAVSFEQLFEQTRSAPWGEWIPKTAAFPVKGHALKSKLASVRDCQTIIKKAVAGALSKKYGIDWLEETGPLYQIQFSILKDRVTLMLDASGEGLHKRGYRRVSNAAPLKETIAAAMVQLSHWKYEYPMADPFCGSGTLPIEAAMLKRNIAPGLTRHFSAENFVQIPVELWEQCRKEAKEAEKNIPLEIYSSDIDPAALDIARANAKIAGVGGQIQFSIRDAKEFFEPVPYGTILCNPPYGERLSDVRSCEELYRHIGKTFSRLDKWSCYIITSHEQFESLFGRKADKKRKLYNGMIKCNIYQYFGPRPPRPHTPKDLPREQ